MTVKCECGSYRRRHWISVTPFQNCVSQLRAFFAHHIHIASLKCAWINFTNRNVCNNTVWYVRFNNSEKNKNIYTALVGTEERGIWTERRISFSFDRSVSLWQKFCELCVCAYCRRYRRHCRHRHHRWSYTPLAISPIISIHHEFV